jgi:hypothetical protein
VEGREIISNLAKVRYCKLWNYTQLPKHSCRLHVDKAIIAPGKTN